MKSLMILTLVYLTLSAPIIPRAAHPAGLDRTSALREIDSIIEKSRQNTPSLHVIRRCAEAAQHNLDGIVEIARLTSEVGHHAGALEEIAKIASVTDHECNCFGQIASIAIRTLSETDKVLDLARQARDAKTAGAMSRLERSIREAEARCDFRTLDEAKAYDRESSKPR